MKNKRIEILPNTHSSVPVLPVYLDHEIDNYEVIHGCEGKFLESNCFLSEKGQSWINVSLLDTFRYWPCIIILSVCEQSCLFPWQPHGL